MPFKEGDNGLIFSLWSLSSSSEVELPPEDDETGPERWNDLPKDLQFMLARWCLTLGLTLWQTESPSYMQNTCDLLSKHLRALMLKAPNFKLWSLFSETALKPLWSMKKTAPQRILIYPLGLWNCAREYRKFWENPSESYRKELWGNDTKWKIHVTIKT